MGLVIGSRKQEILRDKAGVLTQPQEALAQPGGDAQVCVGRGRGKTRVGTHHPGGSLLRFALPAEPGSRWHLDNAVAR